MTKTKLTKSALTTLLILAIFLFGFVGIASVTVSAADDLTDSLTGITLKDTDSDGYYEIANADQLDAFSSLVNTNPSINGELTANITYNTGDLSTLTGQTSGKREWQPFGWKLKTDGTKQHTTVGYTGNFNGNGYTISGLYFFYEMSYDAIGGLVASIRGGSVKNVTVTKSYFAGSSFMGAIAGEMAGGSIENCHNIGSYVGAHRRVGGIVGNVSGGNVTGCTNSGKVEFYMVNSDINATRECYGGIVGSIEYSSGVVSKCTNTGIVSSAGSSITGVAGIAGQIIDGATVDSCLNEGTVSAGASNSLHVGGIAGFIYKANIKNCISLGSVTGYGTVGHVWGSPNTPQSYSNNYYNHTVTVTRTDVQKLWDDGKVISATTSQLYSGEIAHLLGSNFGQNIDNGITNQGHPVIGGAVVRYGYKGCDATVMTYSNYEVQNIQGHNVVYSASGNVITSSCTSLCNKTGTATLTAVKSQYTGSEQKNATVLYSTDWLGGELTPTYLNNVNVGTASASVTIGGVSASVEFEIEKGELKAQHFIFNRLAEGADRYNGKDHSPYVTCEPIDEITGCGEITVRFFKDGIETPPIDAGYYTVKIDVTEGENYKAIEGLVVHSYEIQKAIPNPARPTASEITYGQPLSNSLPSGGWKWDVDTSLIPEVSNSGYTAYLTVNDDHNYDYTNLDGFDFDEETKKLTTTVALLVKKANATVAAEPIANTDLTFNGTAHNLVSIGEAIGGEMQYSLEENGTYISNIPTATGAGTYTVYYKVKGDANHNDTQPASLTVTIKKAVPNYEIPTGLHTTYGNKLSDVELTDGWTWNDNSLSVGSVGNNTFAATFTPEDSVNYETVVRNITVTVSKAAAPVITFPSAEEIIYGELLGNVALTGGSTEFGTFAWKEPSILPQVVNNGYTVVFTPNANTLQNYEHISVTEQTLSLTVMKRALTVTANDKSICVGGEFTLSYTVDGFVGSDTFITEPTLLANATVDTAGKYDINASLADAGENYVITYVKGVLDVHSHEYTGEITTAPTCSSTGEITYTCSHDSNHTYTEPISIDENAHSWNNGVVTTNPTCTEKGVKSFTCTHNSEHTKTEEVNALGHKYDNACDGDCNTCSEARTPDEHYSENADGKCDECGAEIPKDGISGGAVTGIAVGSTAAVGLGGFSLFWFAIKKKKWSDLVNVFKK